VFEGAVEVGGRIVKDGQLAVLGEGNTVRLSAQESGGGRMLLLAGVPLGEPVARYGPFVMNTEREIYDAIRDFQSGRWGSR
jgi:redox-sensitive bicupin YhaK (pirin superfamily)